MGGIRKMGITIICSMRVTDFEEWKVGFDSHASGREKAGISVTAYQNINDPHNAIGIVKAPSKEAWTQFFARSQIQENMRSSGVIGEPDIKLLQEA
jgi:hypothetical protein